MGATSRVIKSLAEYDGADPQGTAVKEDDPQFDLKIKTSSTIHLNLITCVDRSLDSGSDDRVDDAERFSLTRSGSRTSGFGVASAILRSKGKATFGNDLHYASIVG